MDPAAAGLAAGAVLSGLGMLASGLAAVRVTRRRAEDECARRIAEIEKALERGMTLEKRRKNP